MSKQPNGPGIIYNSKEKILTNTPFNPFKSENSSPQNKEIISIEPQSSEDISFKEENLNSSNEREKLKAGLSTKDYNKENNTNNIEIEDEKEDKIDIPKNTEDLFENTTKNKKEENNITWFNRDGRKEKDEYAEKDLKKIMSDYNKISKLKQDTFISMSELESIQFNIYYVKVYSKESPILLQDKLRPRIKFDNLKNVPDILRQNLKLLKYEYLTPVQRVIMPYIQYGKDIVCVSETGSGKTLSYLFSIIGQMLIQGVPSNPYLTANKNNEDNNNENNNKDNNFKNIVAYPICLIIVPSRELALQIAKESKLLAQNTGIKTVDIIGGNKRVHQLIDLSKGCDILVGTPMRLQQYLNMGKIDLKLVKYLILDEADKMLSYEFYHQLKDIFDNLPKKKFRQNLLYSATFNDDVKGIAYYCLNNYYYFNSIKECPKTIKHKFVFCEETENKFENLLKFLKDKENLNKSILIFMNNRKGVDEMMKVLREENIQACSIHGGKTQTDRNKSLRDFTLGYKKILVSTDLLSRGLDFPNIYCVINFDVPNTIEDYIHRIGRTGRLGQKGLAITYLDRIDDTNKENLINLLNNLGEEIPSWINDVEYRGRFNFIEQKNEELNKRNNNHSNLNDNSINNFNNEQNNSKFNWTANKRNNFNDNKNSIRKNENDNDWDNNTNYNNNFKKEERTLNNNFNSNNSSFNRYNRIDKNNFKRNEKNNNNDNSNIQNNNDVWNIDNNSNEIPANAFEELFIRGINYQSEEKDIRDTFSKYGEIVHCKILRDKETNKSKGKGFVKFKEKFQAYNAMKDADNLECQGRKLKINYSNERNGEKNTRNQNINFNNKNRNFQNKRNNNFANNNNRGNNNDDDNGWNEKTKERERRRDKEDKNEDIDSW